MHGTRDRIELFEFKVAASGYDTVRVNTIGLAFDRVRADLMYLDITAADYKRAAADVIAALDAFWREERVPGTRSLTPAEIALADERNRLDHVLQLRIETMYFIAQRLLDGVVSAADSILSPSRGRPRGAKDLGRHRTVRQVLEQRIGEGTAPPASESLFAAIDEVEPIKAYRDLYVAHMPPPTFPSRSPTIRIGAERHEVMANERGVKATGDVDGVLYRYVDAWLDYLDTVSLPFDWPASSKGSRD